MTKTVAEIREYLLSRTGNHPEDIREANEIADEIERLQKRITYLDQFRLWYGQALQSRPEPKADVPYAFVGNVFGTDNEGDVLVEWDNDSPYKPEIGTLLYVRLYTQAEIDAAEEQARRTLRQLKVDEGSSEKSGAECQGCKMQWDTRVEDSGAKWHYNPTSATFNACTAQRTE